MNYIQLKELLDSYHSFVVGKYPQRYLCFDMTHRNNKSLFSFLVENGFFNFCPNRSAKYVYYHQIVNFFDKGRFLPPGLGDNLETHHIDGNPMNNHPSNLVYMSPHDHHICTKFQRRLSKLNVRSFYKLQRSSSIHERTSFNRRGKLIRNWAKWLISIICLTCSKSYQWINYYQSPNHKLPNLPLSSIISWIESFLSKLHWNYSLS